MPPAKRYLDLCIVEFSLYDLACLNGLFMYFCSASEDSRMAQGSGDQRAAGTADPEDSTPNMIVYRKVRRLVKCCSVACACACSVRALCMYCACACSVRVRALCRVDRWLTAQQNFLPKLPGLINECRFLLMSSGSPTLKFQEVSFIHTWY